MITSLKNSLRHLVLPHESNNHRARLLHLQTLFLTVLLLVFSSFIFSELRNISPQILGISHSVTLNELFLLTNQKRIDNNLAPLTLNTELSLAAQKKADDMFSKDYWAHNGPDGTTPWKFIRESGYNYIYAGENLARGYTNGSEVVNAWMDSSSHRLNILSQNYEDVGFAVKTGTIGGEETVLVVQELGGRKEALAQIPKNIPKAVLEVASSGDESLVKRESPKLPGIDIEQKPLINSINFTSTASKLLIALFIGLLTTDMIIAERKKVIRFVGHNMDHIFFLLTILGVLAFLSSKAII